MTGRAAGVTPSAGSNLSGKQKAVLVRAKDDLRKVFHRE